MHCITSYWGKQGPARDRFYAFDKTSGDIVWISEPGIAPKDSSFSTPIVETRYGTRVFYAGTGDGNLVCVNALNGKPLWRFHMSYGGVNSSPLIYKDTVICPHGKENIDTTEEGRMISVKIPESIDFKSPQKSCLKAQKFGEMRLYLLQVHLYLLEIGFIKFPRLVSSLC